MTTAFQAPVDIANRALQHCGVKRITTLADDSKAAGEVNFVYDKVREAELRRNVWRFAIRRCPLWPVETTSMLLNPPLWDQAIFWDIGAIVADTNGALWSSNTTANQGNTPGTGRFWSLYFGPLAVQLYDSGTTYFAGDLVYQTPSPGVFNVYLSMLSSNSDDPSVPDVYSATTPYNAGFVVNYNSVLYQSIINANTGNEPDTNPLYWSPGITTGYGSSQWRIQAQAAVQPLTIVYPIGAGPSSQLESRNVYLLPNGFLREAPQDPKGGSWSPVGGPGSNFYTDWEYESDFIVSGQVGAIVLRFVANVTDVPSMEALFCEGLGCRIAAEVCEPLTQSGGKLQAIRSAYLGFMTEARVVNGIETGSVEPPEDEYIQVRY